MKLQSVYNSPTKKLIIKELLEMNVLKLLKKQTVLPV